MHTEKTIILSKAVLFQGKSYLELKLREPNVNEVVLSSKLMGQKATPTSALDSQVDLLTRISGWPKAAIEDLPTRIMDEAIQWLVKFQERKDVDLDDFSENLDLEITPPIELSNGNRFDTLSLHEPSVGQRKKALRHYERHGENVIGLLEFEIALITDVSGWQLAAVLALPISQFMKATGYLDVFFRDGQETGER